MEIDPNKIKDFQKHIEHVAKRGVNFWRDSFRQAILDMLSSNIDDVLWYGNFLTRFSHEIAFDLPSPAGVYFNMTTTDKKKIDGYTLVINPIYFTMLTQKEQVAVLKHEVSHVINLHFFRFTPEKGYKNRDVTNIALDIAINGEIDNPIIPHLPGSKYYIEKDGKRILKDDHTKSAFKGVFLDMLVKAHKDGKIKEEPQKRMSGEYYYALLQEWMKNDPEFEQNMNSMNQQNGSELIDDINSRLQQQTQDQSIKEDDITQEKLDDMKRLLDQMRKANGKEPLYDQDQQQSQQNQNQSQQQQSQQQQQSSCQNPNPQQNQNSCNNPGQQPSSYNNPSQSQGQQGQQSQSQQGQSSPSGQITRSGGQTSQNQQGQPLHNQEQQGQQTQSHGEGQRASNIGQSIKDVTKNGHRGKSANVKDIQGGGESRNSHLSDEYNKVISELAREMAEAIVKGNFHKGLDDHSLQEKNMPENIDKGTFEKIALSDLKNMINETTRSNGRGFQPGEVDNCILEINKMLKPQVKWDKVLRRVIGQKISRKRVERRAGMPHMLFPEDPNYTGFVKGKDPLVTVVMDVSGSVGDDEIIRGVTEVKDIAKKFGAEVRLVQVDTMVHEVTNVNESLKKINRSAAGGTYLQPAFEFIMDKKNKMGKPNVIVAITDGGCETDFDNGFEIPKDVKVIWLVTRGEKEMAFNYKKYNNMQLIELKEIDKENNISRNL